MRRVALALAALMIGTPAIAAGIAISKSAAPVSDGVSTLGPKVLPGGTLEYTLTAVNPVGNLSTITNVAVCDVLPAEVTMLTSDLGAQGTGPLAFAQGATSSGLAYSYLSLASTTDGLVFYDATGAAIATPTAGSDLRIRKVCATLTGTRMLAAGSFTLRYRGTVR